MHPRSLLLAGLCATAGVGLAGSAVAADATPQLRAHSIFGAPGFHAGAVVQAGVVHARSAPRVRQLCVTPAPIDQPSCGGMRSFAPAAAGTTTVTVDFVDGTSATTSLSVAGGEHALDRPVPVAGHLTCATTTLYGNYDRRRHHLTDAMGTASGGARVALYNRVGSGRFAWVYGSNRAGFVKRGCIARG